MTVMEHMTGSASHRPCGAGEATFFTKLNCHRSNGGRGICGPRRRSRLLRQMALEGKSASSIAAALGAPSRNAVIGKANRIGVKLTGNIHCSAPRASRPSTVRPRRPAIARTEFVVEARRRPRHPARAEAGMAFRRSPGRGDVEGRARGDPRRLLPMAARRSNERGVRLLRRSDREGSLLLRRPLPDGLQAAEFASLGRRALRGHRVHGRLKPQLAA